MRIKAPFFYILIGWATFLGVLTVCRTSYFTIPTDQWLGTLVSLLFFGGIQYMSK